MLGEPLYVGMDLTIASFDAISEVNMVSTIKKVNRRAEYAASYIKQQ